MSAPIEYIPQADDRIAARNYDSIWTVREIFDENNNDKTLVLLQKGIEQAKVSLGQIREQIKKGICRAISPLAGTMHYKDEKRPSSMFA